MKKLIILFIGFSLLSSCSKDDDNEPNNGSIVGEWRLSKLNTEMNIAEGVMKSIGEGKNYNAFMTFTEEPNQVTSKGSLTLVQTVYMGSTPLGTEEMPIDFSSYFGAGKWELSGNTLTLSGQSSNVSVTITKLTSNTLIFNYNPDVTTVLTFEFSK